MKAKLFGGVADGAELPLPAEDIAPILMATAKRCDAEICFGEFVHGLERHRYRPVKVINGDPRVVHYEFDRIIDEEEFAE